MAMNTFDAHHELRGLDRLSVENLRVGRVTRFAMHEAATRVAARRTLGPDNVGAPGGFPSDAEREIADELNDMLAAAQVVIP